MNEKELRTLLQTTPAPDELEAQQRAWEVVRAAYDEREPVRWPRRHTRPLLAFAVAVALVAAALSPPGRSFIGTVRDAIGRERVVGVPSAKPGLVSLPAPGRVLVSSPQGPWIVQPHGSKRRLGAYEQAGWSPHGWFVAATRGRQLVAVEPDGDVRWSLTRPTFLAQPRWSPSGYRIAYRAGKNLRVVAGDGTGDRLLARRVAPLQFAWRPGRQHVLAYDDPKGRIHLVDIDTHKTLWRTKPGPRDIRELAWSADGKRLLVLSQNIHRIYTGEGTLLRTIRRPQNTNAFHAAFARTGHRFAYTEFSLDTGEGTVRLVNADKPRSARTLFQGAGRLQQLAWSPNGRWLLVGWPAADQWLFLRTPAVQKVIAVSNIARTFDPGGSGRARVARPVGWCCPPSP